MSSSLSVRWNHPNKIPFTKNDRLFKLYKVVKKFNFNLMFVVDGNRSGPDGPRFVKAGQYLGDASVGD